MGMIRKISNAKTKCSRRPTIGQEVKKQRFQGPGWTNEQRRQCHDNSQSTPSNLGEVRGVREAAEFLLHRLGEN